jgi:hypothetical protein
MKEKSTTIGGKHFPAVLFLIIIGVLLVVPSIAAAGEITYPVYADEFEIGTDPLGFDTIIMLSPAYGRIASPGDPDLPQMLVEIPVPADIEWSSVEVSVDIIGTEGLLGDYDIAPSPPEGPVNELPYDPDEEFWGEGKVIKDGKNVKVYENEMNYPEESIVLIPYTQRKEQVFGISQEGDAEYEDVNFVRVLYRPFLYNPVSKKLTLITEAIIHITYSSGPIILQNENAGETYDYVIITTNDIVSNSDRLEYFINVKEAMGYSVRVVTEDDYDALTGQAPDGRAEKIRQWLIDNYVSMGIEYVLLIGDPDPDDPLNPSDTVGDIPMKMCWPRYWTWKYRESPTDYFYADLTGNWDIDGDMRYGEAHDSSWTLSPDPSIGPDNFSARWTGWVNCDFTESYTFSTFSDEGVRLYIDGALVIDNWVDHLPTLNQWTSSMTAGKHSIALEFKEVSGDAILKLYWQTNVPDTDPKYVKQAIIPADHLYDDTDTVGGLSVVYFDTADFTGTSIVRTDSTVDFIWGSGDIGRPGGPDVGAEVFVGRIPVYDDNYENLDSILEKITQYETDPGDISWRYSALLPMKPLWDDTPSWHLGELVMNDLAAPAGFTSYRIYDDDYSSTGGPTPDLWPTTTPNVRNEWANGYGVVTWATHGSTTGASDIFGSSDTGSLNDSTPAFTFQGSCLNGHPETHNNLGYALLLEGAVATVSASRVSWEQHGAWTPDINKPGYNHNLAYYYDAKIMNTASPQAAGPALYLSKGTAANVEMNLMDYNLYGDPECYLLLVTLVNFPPVADPNGPYVVDENTTVIFNGSGSYDPDPGDSIALYEWDLDDDGNFETTGMNPEFTWCDDYAGNVTLRVTDTRGASDTASTTVTVNNVAPNVSIDYLEQPNPQFILPLVHTLTFHANFTDPGCDTWDYTWDFDDGTTITGSTGMPGSLSESHIYEAAGNYTVLLEVMDDDGGYGSATMEIHVADAAEAKHDLNEYIQGLPDSAFKGNAAQRKNALDNMFKALDSKIEHEAWNGFIQDITNNVRSKADGYVDGNPSNDWITEETAQQHICMKIDDLVAYIQTFM